jgi:tRNA A-37 threonylcarbamoyl transferase component Bud32
VARVRNIGLPVNDSERKGISYLSRELPANHVLLTNLELPTRNGFAYEYDIIVIADYAVYVVELKGYGGVIKGNALEWELSSGSIVKSPIPLLNTKTKIVASRITTSSHSLSNVWVRPMLVLTDDQVRVQVQDPLAGTIKKLDECVQTIRTDVGRSGLITPEMGTHIEEAIAKQFLPLKRDKEIGDYRILQQVNTNDLYTTLIAEHKLLGGGRRYVLKVYTLKIYDNPEEQRKHQTRVLREANTLFELPPHPNLVRANPPFPAGDDKIVLPLEWVDGRALRGLLDDRETAAAIAVKKVLLELCSVLTHVHGYGVIHRDLRPDNVIVCPEGGLRLVNFDCAHLGGQAMSTIATRVGRRLDERYVAPEVWLDPANATKSSDIYSLGIIFHELLTGRTPYQKIMDVYKSREVKSSIGELRPDLDGDAERLFLAMCAFDPQSRCSDLAEIKGRIERIL